MTEAMKITLSTQPADGRWGEKATWSINNDGIALHLNGKDDLGLIQRAARKIDGMGIKHVALSGEGWNTDRAWAFWAGYKGPKGQRQVEWPSLDDAQRSELDNRQGQNSTAEFDAFRAQMTRNISTLQSQVQNLQQQISAR